MRTLITCFLCTILFHSSLDAQYGWIEKKYKQPVQNLSSEQYESLINTARSLKNIGIIITSVGIGMFGLALVSLYTDLIESFEVVGTLLIGSWVVIPVGLIIIGVGTNRIHKLNQFVKNNQVGSALSIQPLFLRTTIDNTVAPGFSICYRF